MRFFIKIFCLLLLTTLVCVYCRKAPQPTQKKYEEDPSTSSKPPQDRLIGVWRLTGYTFKGVSMRDSLNKLFNNHLEVMSAQLIYQFIQPDEFHLKIGALTKSQGMPGSFDETNIQFDVDWQTDSAHVMWFISPFKFQTQLKSRQWFVTKLFEDNLNIVLRTDTGEFKMLFSKQ